MRIVFVATSSLLDPSPRGRWLPLGRELARIGHEVHLLMLHPVYATTPRGVFLRGGVHCRYVAQMHVRGYPGARRYYSGPALLAVAARGALALAAAAAALRPDALHIAKAQPINGLAGLLAARAVGALYLDADDYEAGANRFGAGWQARGVQFWEDRLPGLMRAVSVNTTFLADRFVKSAPQTPVVLIPNGADPPARVLSSAERSSLRAALGLGAAPTAVYLGTLSTIAHATPLLLDAFAEVLAQVPTARLLLVGDGDDAALLRGRAAALGIADALTFTGRVAPQLGHALLQCAEVSVEPVEDTPAARARSPLKLVESMACGVPVVSGDVGDRAATLGPDAGISVLPGDASALAAGISALLGDPLRQQRGAAAAAERAQEYRWDRLAARWLALYC